MDGWYHLVAYGSWSLTIQEHNYHSTKQEFLALKLVVAEQFQEYLLWKPFIVRVNNNPLTYMMTTPNVDATQHQWVELLARFAFSIEYQKGRGNLAADALSWVTSKLDAEIMKSNLDRVTVGMTDRADTQDLEVAKAGEDIHKPVQETMVLARASQTCIDLHVTDWVTAQQEDPILKTVIKWISNWKVQYPKHLLGDDAKTEGGKTSPGVEEANTLPRSPLPSSHTKWWVGRSFTM